MKRIIYYVTTRKGTVVAGPFGTAKEAHRHADGVGLFADLYVSERTALASEYYLSKCPYCDDPKRIDEASCRWGICEREAEGDVSEDVEAPPWTGTATINQDGQDFYLDDVRVFTAPFSVPDWDVQAARRARRAFAGWALDQGLSWVFANN